MTILPESPSKGTEEKRYATMNPLQAFKVLPGALSETDIFQIEEPNEKQKMECVDFANKMDIIAKVLKVSPQRVLTSSFCNDDKFIHFFISKNGEYQNAFMIIADSIKTADVVFAKGCGYDLKTHYKICSKKIIMVFERAGDA